MFRVLFLRNGNANSDESFIDAASYETLDQVKEKAIVDAAEWIAERYNKSERWTAEIVQVITTLERTGGTPAPKKGGGTNGE